MHFLIEPGYEANYDAALYIITGIVVCMFAHVYMFQVSNHSGALCWLDYFLGMIHHRSVSGTVGSRNLDL